MMENSDIAMSRGNDREWVMGLIRSIVDKAPRRPPASPGELTAQQMIESELNGQGVTTTWHRFRFHRSIFADFALHFGLAVAATAISGICPIGAAVVHALVAFSYAMQSSRRYAVLRRLYRKRPSQNLVGVIPAQDVDNPSLRVVLMGHADASYSGLVFTPDVIRSTMYAKGPFKRSVALATWCTAFLVLFDVARFTGAELPYARIVEWVLTVPAMIAFFLNFDVFLRDRQVPGANDNLTAAAALPVLAKRLAPVKPPDVELVFLLTGCEEAGLGGAIEFAKHIENRWDRSKTVFVGMDGLTNGQLRFCNPEGELFKLYPSRCLVDLAGRTAASRPGNPFFNDVTGYDVSVGGTDVAALQAKGWEGISFVAIDPAIGAPLHYHTMNDTPDNLDPENLMNSIDFIEQFAVGLMGNRGSRCPDSTSEPKA